MAQRRRAEGPTEARAHAEPNRTTRRAVGAPPDWSAIAAGWSPHGLPHGDVTSLQRTMGNRATGSVIRALLDGGRVPWGTGVAAGSASRIQPARRPKPGLIQRALDEHDQLPDGERSLDGFLEANDCDPGAYTEAEYGHLRTLYNAMVALVDDEERERPERYDYVLHDAYDAATTYAEEHSWEEDCPGWDAAVDAGAAWFEAHPADDYAASATQVWQARMAEPAGFVAAVTAQVAELVADRAAQAEAARLAAAAAAEAAAAARRLPPVAYTHYRGLRVKRTSDAALGEIVRVSGNGRQYEVRWDTAGANTNEEPTALEYAPGAMIPMSIDERRAAVVADSGIAVDAISATDEGTWGRGPSLLVTYAGIHMHVLQAGLVVQKAHTASENPRVSYYRDGRWLDRSTKQTISAICAAKRYSIRDSYYAEVLDSSTGGSLGTRA